MKALWTLFLVLVLMTGCSRVTGLISKATNLAPQDKKEKKKDDGAPQSLLSSLNGGTVSTDGGIKRPKMEMVEVGSVGDIALLPASRTGGRVLPKDDEILFIDPDADDELAEQQLADLRKGKKVDWLESFTQARRLSSSEGQPLMIWFTASPGERSVGSPTSAVLERELFNNEKFAKWASENLLRLKLDYTVKGRNSSDGAKKMRARQQEKYLESLKKRYNVNGFPAILVLAPDGSVINNIRGYSAGQSEYVWGLLRTAAEHSEKRWQDYQKKLSKKGYRKWSGKNGVEVFARLLSYDKGKLVLVTPDGARLNTTEGHLSSADRAWIESEKAKRKSR